MLSPTNSYKPETKIRPKRHYLLSLLLLAWIAIVVLAIFNVRNILDWFKLHGYHPPQNISTLASEDTMTPYATKIFKVNHPSIESETTFDKNCPNDGGEKTIVLGCYHSNQDGIYLLNVNDPRLDGVQQVTAAHEMLHAAYDRLSSSEKTKVDAMLLNYYNHDLHNQRILNDLKLYRQTEPGEVVNEMHSIFGTEIANLPSRLENYYKKYFSDRQKIAAYANQYESVFTTRQNEVNADDAQLNSLKNQIDSLEADIEAKYKSITAENTTLNSERTSDPASYNASVPGYNQQVDTYEAEAIQVNSLVNQYNELVAQRNNIALTENQLYSELSGVKSN
jgi:hypothetical protein